MGLEISRRQGVHSLTSLPVSPWHKLLHKARSPIAQVVHQMTVVELPLINFVSEIMLGQMTGLRKTTLS